MELDVDTLCAWHGSGPQRTQILDRISLQVPAGELGALLGPSGSGKTTLLRAIAGLHADVRGTIVLGGERLDGMAPEHRRIGLVPQDGALFPHLTVKENIGFGVKRPNARDQRINEMLDLLDLGTLADRLPHQISGGQAQRVAVARALAPAPRLLLLDEPFSALDAGLRVEVRDGVMSALRETHTTALLVTHDQGEAMSMAGHLVVVANGRITQAGSPRVVYAHPVDVWTGRFLGEANLFETQTDGNTAMTPFGPAAHAEQEPGNVTVLVRPEQLRLSTSEGTEAMIVAIRYFGHDSLMTLRSVDQDIEARLRLVGNAAPAIGTRVRVTVDGPVKAFRN